MRKLDPANLKLISSLFVLVFLFASIAIIVKYLPQQREIQPKASTSVTLRPNGPGYYTQWPSQYPNSGSHWEKVREASSDEDSTYIREAGLNLKDSFTHSPSNIPAGSDVSNVTVYARAKLESGSGGSIIIHLFWPSGEDALSCISNITTSYQTYACSTTAYGLADVNQLQLGVRESSIAASRVTQVYMVVEYTPPSSCSDECSPSGAKQCAGSTQYQTCGNYDADSCLEWSSSVSCPSGQTCSGSGVCSTSGGGTSGGGTKPGGGTKTGGGTKSSGSTGTLTTLQLNISVPYLIGGTKISVMMGSLTREILVLPDKKDYSLDVKEAGVSLGSSTTVVVGGNKTLIKKIQVTPTSETTAVNVGDLFLGDITGDNKIDDKDSLAFLDSIGKQTSKGDFNADKTANSLDWAILLANFGKSGDFWQTA